MACGALARTPDGSGRLVPCSLCGAAFAECGGQGRVLSACGLPEQCVRRGRGAWLALTSMVLVSIQSSHVHDLLDKMP
jgi:hypothetical protein